jgi:hypothetical protein
VDFLSEAIKRHQVRKAIPGSDYALVLFERSGIARETTPA